MKKAGFIFLCLALQIAGIYCSAQESAETSVPDRAEVLQFLDLMRTKVQEFGGAYRPLNYLKTEAIGRLLHFHPNAPQLNLMFHAHSWKDYSLHCGSPDGFVSYPFPSVSNLDVF
jgi:hypothetical protein